MRSGYETQTNAVFEAWATALILTSVCTDLWLPDEHRTVSPKAPSLSAVAASTQISQHKDLGDCFQVGNNICTGQGGTVRVFGWETHRVEVPSSEQNSWLAEPRRKRQAGAVNCEGLQAVKEV